MQKNQFKSGHREENQGPHTARPFCDVFWRVWPGAASNDQKLNFHSVVQREIPMGKDINFENFYFDQHAILKENKPEKPIVEIMRQVAPKNIFRKIEKTIELKKGPKVEDSPKAIILKDRF